jgi:hypothetical protein
MRGTRLESGGWGVGREVSGESYFALLWSDREDPPSVQGVSGVLAAYDEQGWVRAQRMSERDERQCGEVGRARPHVVGVRVPVSEIAKALVVAPRRVHCRLRGTARDAVVTLTSVARVDLDGVCDPRVYASMYAEQDAASLVGVGSTRG